MKTIKASHLLLAVLSLVFLSSLAWADTITLVNSANPGVSTLITTTTSADGKTIGITFTNQSDPALKVRILAVGFTCSACTPATQSSVGFSDSSVSWAQNPIDHGGNDFTYSSIAGHNLQALPGLPNAVNLAGPQSVASGITGNISLSFASAFFPNGLSANSIFVLYLYQDANGNWQRGVPVGNANVPEPATLLLLGSGLAAIGLKARQRKR